jgi:predicted nucleic acid-binding protein
LPFVALLDANALYPARLRDVLLSVAESGLYRVIWTQRILDEMVTSVLTDRPDLTAAQLQGVVACMNRAFPDALITGHETLEGAMTNHAEDRHVLAACIRGRADVVVTGNVKHFPPESCAPFDLDVQTPDEFLLHAYDLRPERFMSAVSVMLQRNQSSPRTIPEFLESLRMFTPELVERIRQGGLADAT